MPELPEAKANRRHIETGALKRSSEVFALGNTEHVAEKGLGPDAMQICDNAFAARASGGRGAVKSALHDQKKLAGVGNLWSDDALYRTLPDATAVDLPAVVPITSPEPRMRRVRKIVLESPGHHGRAQ